MNMKKYILILLAFVALAWSCDDGKDGNIDQVQSLNREICQRRRGHSQDESQQIQRLCENGDWLYQRAYSWIHRY